MAIVNRAERKHYLNTGSLGVPVWSPIGEGFTEFMESKNAVSCSRRYIHETTKRTDVTGYAPVIDYEFEVYSDNPVIELLREITDRELCGERAQVDVLTVDLFSETAASGVYRAFRRRYSVIPDECGEGTDTLCYTGTMKAVGDVVHGVYVMSTGIFTAE